MRQWFMLCIWGITNVGLLRSKLLVVAAQRMRRVDRYKHCQYQDEVTEAGWNDSNLSAKQIEAKVQERQVAVLKRERTLAYARTL
jgi:hypothetical protein